MHVSIFDIARKIGVDSEMVREKASELGLFAGRWTFWTMDEATAEGLEREVLTWIALMKERGLAGFHLGNFKAFANTQTIPLRPLTLIFGANSSGKSSAIHGLLFAHHALVSNDLNVTLPKLGGKSVDLGGFSQFVHRRESGRRIEWAAELRSDALSGQARQLLGTEGTTRVTLSIGVPVDRFGKVAAGGVPRLVGYEIEAGGRSVLRLSRRPDESLHLDRFDPNLVRPLVQAVVQSLTTAQRVDEGADLAEIEQTVQSLIPSIRFSARGLLPEHGLGDAVGEVPKPELVAIEKGKRREQLLSTTKLFVPRAIGAVVSSVNTAVREQLGRLQYLGPLRSFPPRHLAFRADEDQNWYAGGAYAWELVKQDVELREKVNRWLGSKERLQTPYRLTVEFLASSAELRAALGDGIGSLIPDVLGVVLGQSQAAAEESRRLVESWEEMETKLADMVRGGEEARERLAACQGALKASESRIRNVAEKLEKLRRRRNALAHSRPANEGMKVKPSAVENDLASLNKELAGEQAKHTELKREEQRWLEKESNLSDTVTDLEKQKAAIFAGFRSHLDEDAWAQRLYDRVRSGAESNAPQELVLVDCRTETPVSHRDVGIGVSQVLPVLVHAYADRGQIVAIEQPEIHLHPALQAELADVFIESALGANKNTFLLETHSEHLILRILRRVRETTEGTLPPGTSPVRPEDVSVVFVEPTAKGSVVRQMTVTPDGDFAEPWPGGFFAERFKDLP